MSITLDNIKELLLEKKLLISKTIKKERRKNQYSTEFVFGSNVNTELLKKIESVFQQIPNEIQQNIICRLESNIQIPLPIKLPYNIGCLPTDPYSFNYRVYRYDQCNGVHIFHYDIIDRPYTPFTLIQDVFKKRNTNLSNVFENFHSAQLEGEQYQLSSEQEIKEFENKLQCPYSMYIHKKQNGKIITKARVFNDKYLQLLGINSQILQNYIAETGCLPTSYMIDRTKLWDQNIMDFFICSQKLVEIQGVATNYTGQRFPVAMKQHKFSIHLNGQVSNSFYQNQQNDEDSTLLLHYYSIECDNKWLMDNVIQQNEIDYFNLKEQQWSEKQPKRCGIRKMSQ